MPSWGVKAKYKYQSEVFPELFAYATRKDYRRKWTMRGKSWGWLKKVSAGKVRRAKYVGDFGYSHKIFDLWWTYY